MNGGFLVTDNEWLSVSEVSEKVNIPVETIRRYIRSHNVHLKVKRLHKKYYLHDEALTVIERIRGLYADGKNVEEVEEALSLDGIPMTLTVENSGDERVTVHVADELKAIRQQLEEQKQFNIKLIEELKNQRDFIELSIEKRDRQLMEVLKENQQARIEQAASQEKKGFFSRLFTKK
jgi:DNA-binding transcriptional MerR regulator